MNKKVLKVMIGLVVVFLTALYILKFAFPEKFVLAVENEVFIQIGDYIDQHVWATVVFASFTSFVGYWLYICAVTRKWYLNWKELIVVLLVIAITQTLFFFEPDIANCINVVAMICIPLMSKARLQEVAIVYSLHYISQMLSLKIRNLPILLTHINSVISICLTIEGIFWLLLFYLYFNYPNKKEAI